MTASEKEYLNLLEGIENVCRLGHDHWAVWRQMYDMKSTDNEAVNYAPAFYQLTESAHFNCFILELAKLYDSNFKNTVCLLGYIYFVCDNQGLFNAAKYDCDLLENITEDEYVVYDNYRIVERLRKWRNKTIAHLDIEYLEKGRHPVSDYPIEVREIGQLLEQAAGIINRYSRYYNGHTTMMKTVNVNDFKTLIRYAKAGKKAITDGYK